MSSTHQTSESFRFTGRHMLACMLMFFGTIIAVNLTMAYLATGSWTGLVVKNSYVASQGFNERLSKAKQQVQLGLRSNLAFSNGSLSFKIYSEKENFIKPEQAAIWIGRPAFEQEDRTLAAECQSDGVCSADVDLAIGPWAIRIEALLPDGNYRRDARFTVDAAGNAKVD